MALGTPIDRDAFRRNGGTGTISSSSFTPSADSLLLCSVLISNDDATSIPGSLTAHDGGSAWVQLSSTQGLLQSTIRSHSLWGCFTGSSPSADTVDVAFSTDSPMGCCLVEVPGADVSGTVANALTEIASSVAESTTISATLTSAPSDLTVGFFGACAINTITVENTLLNTINFQYGDNVVACDYINAGDQTHAATITSSRWSGAFVIDVKEPGGAATTAPTIYANSNQIIY